MCVFGVFSCNQNPLRRVEGGGDYSEIPVKERLDYEESDFDKWYCGWCGLEEDCKCNDEDVTGCLTHMVMLTPEEMEEHLEDVKQRAIEEENDANQQAIEDENNFLNRRAEQERQRDYQENNLL
jgi:hypothetical protein